MSYEISNLVQISIHMEDMMSFSTSSESDEFNLYECERFTDSIISDIRSTFAGIRYCVSKRNMYPALSRVALWLLATHGSSAQRERDFSSLNRYVITERSHVKDGIIEDLVYTNPFLILLNVWKAVLVGGRRIQGKCNRKNQTILWCIMICCHVLSIASNVWVSSSRTFLCQAFIDYRTDTGFITISTITSILLKSVRP